MSYVNYIKAGLLVILVCGIFFAGWHTRDRDFTIYKDQVRIAAEKQEAENEAKQKEWQNQKLELVNKLEQLEDETQIAELNKQIAELDKLLDKCKIERNEKLCQGKKFLGSLHIYLDEKKPMEFI